MAVMFGLIIECICNYPTFQWSFELVIVIFDTFSSSLLLELISNLEEYVPKKNFVIISRKCPYFRLTSTYLLYFILFSAM